MYARIESEGTVVKPICVFTLTFTAPSLHNYFFYKSFVLTNTFSLQFQLLVFIVATIVYIYIYMFVLL